MHFKIAGEVLVCINCGGVDFEKGECKTHPLVQMTDAHFAEFDTIIFLCRQCGRQEWFSDIGAGIEEIFQASEACTCTSCSAFLPAGIDTCPKCGWSFFANET